MPIILPTINMLRSFTVIFGLLIWQYITVIPLVYGQEQAEHVVRPLDTGAELSNPGMGWMLYYFDNSIAKYGAKLSASDTLPDWPGLSLVFLRIPWAYIEPEEGRFNWAVIDTLMQRFATRGLTTALSFSCTETSMEYPTPKWVHDAGAKGYRFKPRQIDENGPFWEPDYDDPIFLEKLDHFLGAVAARYDGNPQVAFIDISSFGVWGEGHTWCSTRKEYPTETIRRHIALHCKHFKKTLILGMDDFLSRPGAQPVWQPGLIDKAFDIVLPLSFRGKTFTLRAGIWEPKEQDSNQGERLLPWHGNSDRSVSLGTLQVQADGTPVFTPSAATLPEAPEKLKDGERFAVVATGLRHDALNQPHSCKLAVRWHVLQGIYPKASAFLHLVDAASPATVYHAAEEREDDALTDFMAAQGLGIRDNSILVQPTVAAYFHGAMMQRFWPHVPVVIETEHYGLSVENKAWGDGSAFLQSIEDYHASYASIHWWPEEFLKENRELVRQINLRLGYRMVLTQASWPRQIALSQEFPISWQWRNAGVAPCYKDYYPAITLKDADGGITAVLVDDEFSLRNLPVSSVAGKSEAVTHSCNVQLPVDLKPGEYEVFVSVGDKVGSPSIALPLSNGDAQHRYPVGKTQVVK